LLHIVDIAPLDSNVDPADEMLAIQRELGKFSADLTDKPRWLIINKIDLLAEDDRADARRAILEKTEWSGPVFEVSAATGEGTEALGQAVMRQLQLNQEEAELAE
jgi:GTP-binding protein